MVDLATLVGDWQIKTSTFILPAIGVSQCAEANPRRWGIGFSHFKNSDVAVSPLVPGQGDLNVNLGPFSFVWFEWPKHNVLVTMPWLFHNYVGGAESLVVCEI